MVCRVVERTLALAHVLLLFVGLGVMLIGGAGISGAVRAHVAAKMETIAILKSIGTPPAVVTLAIAFQVMAATIVGTVLGVACGAAGPVLAANALADQLPFILTPTPAIKPLLGAGVFGVLVATLFAWWPLMGVKDMNARVLLRERIQHTPGRLSVWGWSGAGAIFTALIAVVFWVSPMPVLTAIFLSGALFLAGLYYALGRGLSRLAKVLAKGRGAGLRLALGNLHRAGAPTGPVVMALGLTLTLLVALAAIGSAAGRHVETAMPTSAPDLVAFSLKPEAAMRLDAMLAASAMVERHRILPFLHARVQGIGGVAVRDLKIPASLNWVVRGDRGVSFALHPPHDNFIVEGAWWNDAAAQRPGFSVDAAIAKKLGLVFGSRITLNVSGHALEGPVLNLRDVDWTGLDLDFPIIATPGTFTGISPTLAASLKAKPGPAMALETAIKNQFPDTPLVRVADVLGALANALDAVVAGLKAAALMCGVAAVVVLAGSVLQGLSERTDEAVLFKVLGARRGQLLAQVTVEFFGLGILVAVAAVPLGLAVAFGVSQAAGLAGFAVAWSSVLALAVGAVMLTLAVGVLVTWGAYRATPSRLLRSRGV